MRIGLVAGEASGDLLGGGLIAALKRRVPGLRCEGVAGTAMQAAGCEALANADDLAVMGLVEPLRHVPRLVRLRRRLFRHWSAQPPDVFVGIDAPDFNLGLERALKERGIPVIHYVSPSVWAWRQRRVHKIGRAVDRVLCLLPFEKAFYDRHGVPAEFVGHPLADRLPRNLSAGAARATLGLEAERVVAILPGSRTSEVSRLGPVFIETARLLQSWYGNIDFVTPLANPATADLFARQLDEAKMTLAFTLLKQRSEQAILAADAVLLASGTAALETALLGRSMVAAYKLAPVSYWLARALRLVKVRHFTLPNHLTSEPLVPEYVQGAANPATLTAAVRGLLDDDERRHGIEASFRELRGQLALDANERAADAVLRLAGGDLRT